MKKKRRLSVDIYFGVPGSGKTTMAAWLSKRSLKRGYPVYSNVPITGALSVKPHYDIGHYMIQDATLIIDEAGIDYNNRDTKQMSSDEIFFYKYHRHYRVQVNIFSQSYDDMDITLRRLAQNFFVVQKSLIPFFVKSKRIGRRIGINKDSHQIEDEYFFSLFGFRYIFSPALWSMFNTYSCKKLPEKDWSEW